MRPTKTVLYVLAITAAAFAFSATSQSASAQESYNPRTYKVQVQYWFFDTDYCYWSTKLETPIYNDAVFLYEVLSAAHDEGILNQVAPNSYWRYIAVDVRMITVYNYPTFERAQYVQPAYSYNYLRAIDD
jgi:hypothetical protein